MLTTFTLALAVTVADPRPALVELQLAGQHREALARVDRELAEHASAARRMGLDYLRGHLFDLLGEPALASEAFGAAMSATPSLALHARYRMALAQEQMRHPEVAAGPLAESAGSILRRTLLGRQQGDALGVDQVGHLHERRGQGQDGGRIVVRLAPVRGLEPDGRDVPQQTGHLVRGDEKTTVREEQEPG